MTPVARDLAIDLGTANTLVYARDRGVVLNQPTVVALDTRTRQVLAIGDAVWEMVGRTPDHVVAIRPLREGAITDFDLTQRMIRRILKEAGVTKFNRTRVLICVPSAITSVERRAVKQAARQAGASSAHLIEQSMAAAIGTNLDVHEPKGNMVVDIGGGTTEAAVISLGGVVASRSVRCGGLDLDGAIVKHLRVEHSLAVSDRTAEALKLALGSALRPAEERKAEVSGRDISTGEPRSVILTQDEIFLSMSEQLDTIMAAVVGCLSDSPPELAQDIIYEGIHLLGGSALLPGMVERLSQVTDVPVRLAPNPIGCVVEGAGLCLSSFDDLRPIFAAAEG